MYEVTSNLCPDQFVQRLLKLVRIVRFEDTTCFASPTDGDLYFDKAWVIHRWVG